jgi:hypothetical protein
MDTAENFIEELDPGLSTFKEETMRSVTSFTTLKY